MSHNSEEPSGFSSLISYIVSIFAAVGLGVGLTAAVLMNVLGGGSGFASGFILLIVIAVSLLLGPVVASVVGIQTSERESTKWPFGSMIGCSLGFLVMMGVILVMMIFGLGLVSMGGGAEAGGSGSGGGSGFNAIEYVVPVLLVAIPTGLTGAATSYLHGRSASSRSGTRRGSEVAASNVPTKPDISLPNVSKKYLIGGGLAVILLVGGAFGATALLSLTADNVEVSGSVTELSSGFRIPVDVSNTGDEVVEAQLEVKVRFDGNYKQSLTESEEITLEPGETYSRELYVSFDELSSAEKEAYDNGNYRVEFIINGDVKDTYPTN